MCASPKLKAHSFGGNFKAQFRLRAAYVDQRTRLQELTDGGAQARALVALAKAASYVNEDNEFSVMASRAFEQGGKVYGLDYGQRPDLRADLHRGYGELSEIVRFATTHNLDWVDRIRLLHNVELKGNLLDYAAAGLADRKAGTLHD